MLSLLLVLLGFFAGLLGAMTGIGGGILLSPILALHFGIPICQAIGTSLVAVIKPPRRQALPSRGGAGSARGRIRLFLHHAGWAAGRNFRARPHPRRGRARRRSADAGDPGGSRRGGRHSLPA